jgi:hypothetical protein
MKCSGIVKKRGVSIHEYVVATIRGGEDGSVSVSVSTHRSRGALHPSLANNGTKGKFRLQISEGRRSADSRIV